MLNKQKLYLLALVSTAVILTLTNIASAPFAYITNYGSNNVSVIDTANNTIVTI